MIWILTNDPLILYSKYQAFFTKYMDRFLKTLFLYLEVGDMGLRI